MTLSDVAAELYSRSKECPNGSISVRKLAEIVEQIGVPFSDLETILLKLNIFEPGDGGADYVWHSSLRSLIHYLEDRNA